METKWFDELRGTLYFVGTLATCIGGILLVVPTARAVEIGVVLLAVGGAAFQAARRIKSQDIDKPPKPGESPPT